LYLKLPFFRGFQAINLDYSREKDGFTEIICIFTI